jgi:hypothetical protein
MQRGFSAAKIGASYHFTNKLNYLNVIFPFQALPFFEMYGVAATTIV